jgi:hypothetical protein
VWQPSRAQWRIIWPLALFIVLAWPGGDGRSLGVKALNWIADPQQTLPSLPPQLPMGLDDDGDAVAAHDAQEMEYFRALDGSSLTRFRIRMKEANDPFESSTERQLVVGVGVLGALLIWRLQAKK